MCYVEPDESEALQAIKRDGTPHGRLAMARYGLSVCCAHGGYAAAVRIGLRRSTRKSRRSFSARLA